MSKLYISEHPLVQDKVARLRDKNTGAKEFKELVEEVTMLLAYEATRSLPLREVEVETPMGKTMARELKDKLCIVPVLRAGIGMTDGLWSLMPTAKVGHIGIYRDPESLLPVEYFCKLPGDLAERLVFVADSMLATGGTAEAAIGFLKDRGAQRIILISMIAAPEAVRRIQEAHPDVDIYAAAFDPVLDESGYIVPGLGDVGDRIFGTK